MARWRKHFSQLLNVHGVNAVRQPEMHTAEPQVPEPSAFEVEMAIEKLKRQKSPSIDQISAELIKAAIEKFALKLISLFILFGIRMTCLRGGMSQSLYLSTLFMIKQIAVILEAYHPVNYVGNFTQHHPVKVNSRYRGNYWGSSMWTSMQRVNYWSYILHSSNTWEKMGIQWSSTSAVYILQESLWLSKEGSLVRYSYWVW